MCMFSFNGVSVCIMNPDIATRFLTNTKSLWLSRLSRQKEQEIVYSVDTSLILLERNLHADPIFPQSPPNKNLFHSHPPDTQHESSTMAITQNIWLLALTASFVSTPKAWLDLCGTSLPIVSSTISCLNQAASCAASLGVSPVRVNGRQLPPSIKWEAKTLDCRINTRCLSKSQLSSLSLPIILERPNFQLTWMSAYLSVQLTCVYKLWRFKELSYWLQIVSRVNYNWLSQHCKLGKLHF